LHHAILKNEKSSQAIKRRMETFAEAEQRLKDKNVEVGILGSGEIVGMCELIFDMPTYMQSTKCLEDCDVYYIYKRSYERLIAKRNPTCINKMKEHVYMKLIARNNRLKNSVPVDLYRSIEYKIELSQKRKPANEIQNATPVGGGAFPSRGPIIFLDLKPKSAAYNRLKKQNEANRKIRAASQLANEEATINNNFLAKEISQSTNTKNDLPSNLINTTLLPAVGAPSGDSISASTFSNELREELQKAAEQKRNNNLDEQILHAINNNNSGGNNEGASKTELDALEDRIKQWHLDLGAKKIYFTKLNRIDTNVTY
jgi:hypothetical protein